MTSLTTIKNWFKTGLKPTQQQFWDTWDSFWHKEDRIPVTQIDGVDNLLDQKANKSIVDNHLADSQAHAALFLQKEDVSKKGQANGYTPLNALQKISAQYLEIINNLTAGGATALLSAEMGKQLQSQINGINVLLQSNDVNLDNVQEIVDAIKTVQLALSSILVNDLTTGGISKALSAEMGKNLSENKVNKSITITINGQSYDLSANRSWNVTSSGVDLTTDQTIAGIKTFSKDLFVNGLRIGKGPNSGFGNSAFGKTALENVTSGAENTAIGDRALYSKTTGSSSTAVGNRSLYQFNGFNSVAIGADALLQLISGFGNIGIGYNAQVPNPNGSQQLSIGNWIYGKDGRISINTTVDDGVNHLQVYGSAKATQFNLSALNIAPTSSSAVGTLGEIRITSGYIYVCIATNTWVRTALTTF
jgi:hypothetical protein